MTTLLQATRIAMAGGEAVMSRLGAGDWMYSVDLANALIALLDAQSPRHRLYHLGVEAPFSTPDWCARLQRYFPDFRYRESDVRAECNVAPLSAFRVPFSTRRLREDVAFQPRFAGIDAAFADYMNWLAAHRDFVLRS
jgi:UDP-glucose 4-epimerase